MEVFYDGRQSTSHVNPDIVAESWSELVDDLNRSSEAIAGLVGGRDPSDKLLLKLIVKPRCDSK